MQSTLQVLESNACVERKGVTQEEEAQSPRVCLLSLRSTSHLSHLTFLSCQIPGTWSPGLKRGQVRQFNAKGRSWSYVPPVSCRSSRRYILHRPANLPCKVLGRAATKQLRWIGCLTVLYLHANKRLYAWQNVVDNWLSLSLGTPLLSLLKEKMKVEVNKQNHLRPMVLSFNK